MIPQFLQGQLIEKCPGATISHVSGSSHLAAQAGVDERRRFQTELFGSTTVR
ncbi:MAG: hypothetical protein AB8B63_18085 [Granulosicoccus sp.]